MQDSDSSRPTVAPDPLVADELALLERVKSAIAEGPTRLPPSESAVAQELERLREQMLASRDPTDQAALSDQWSRQSSLLRQLRSARRSPPVGLDNPYFGHLQLREDGREWDLCLGKTTFIQGDVTIVDWRNAPISRIFYRYRQEDQYEEDIAGRTRTGEVAARRTVAIRDGSLTRVDAPEGVFVRQPGSGEWERVEHQPPRLAGGQGAALQVYRAAEAKRARLGTSHLGARQRADKHLPDIAGLIDPEQFRLISSPSSGLVVIRGTAGSGKTTVALHRIAYLAYEDPRIDSARTMFLAFSPALRDYVSHVLPALGVGRVQVRTFRDWALEQRRRLFPQLPRESSDGAPSIVQRLALHPAMLDALAAQVERVEGPRTALQVIDDWGSALGSRDLLEQVLGRVAAGAFTPGEIERASDWCRKRHQQIVAWMDGDRSVQAEIGPEDDALLLRCWQLRAGALPGPNGPLRYRHVAVDEVQDFSPLEVRVLLDCLDQHRSMTLAGDTQQHVLEDAGFTSWNDFFGRLGLAGTEVSTLRVSYRSTRPIVELATSLLGDLREDDEVPLTTRDGPDVEYFRFTDPGACAAFLGEALDQLSRHEPLASVALLTPSPAVSAMYHAALANAEVARLRLVENQRFAFTPGVDVTEIGQVKGLEFDYVVLVEVSAEHFPDTAHARRLLHVGATRAIHQLWLTSVGTPSPVIRPVIGGA